MENYIMIEGNKIPIPDDMINAIRNIFIDKCIGHENDIEIFIRTRLERKSHGDYELTIEEIYDEYINWCSVIPMTIYALRKIIKKYYDTYENGGHGLIVEHVDFKN